MEVEEKIKLTGIPGLDELIKGFPRGGLIIVSGIPGTGKTVFASSFIYHGAVKYDEPGIFVSLIEDEKRFYTYMKGFGMNFEKLSEKRLFKYIPLLTLLEPSLASSIDVIVENIVELNAKRLVIDSYTAMNRLFRSQREARSFLHSILSKMVSQLECTTILIKEEKTQEKKEFDYVDFIADGVIHLKYGAIEDKFYRELCFIKMRSSEVRNQKTYFTVRGGFKVMTPTKTPRKQVSVKLHYPENPPERYTTGIPDLDLEIGGYPDKTVVLFEIDPKLTFKDYMILTVPTIAAYLLKNGYCLAVPSGGVTWDVLLDAYIMYGVDEELFRRNYYLITEPDYKEKENENIIKIEPNELAVKGFLEVEDILVKRYGKPPIRLFGIDRLIQYYGERVSDLLYVMQDEVKKRGGLVLWIAKPVKPWLIESLAPLADLHFKIFRKHGCIFVYGIKPRTPLYGTKIMEEDPIPSLIPIV